LEQELRRDTIGNEASNESQALGASASPQMLFSNNHGALSQEAAERKMYENIYTRPTTQWKYTPNVLGDYSDLVKQLDGQLTSFADGFVLSTIESQRPTAKLADTTTDGYDLLANTFNLTHHSNKRQKKDSKIHHLGQQTLV
jgi:hypothetical protein